MINNDILVASCLAILVNFHPAFNPFSSIIFPYLLSTKLSICNPFPSSPFLLTIYWSNGANNRTCLLPCFLLTISNIFSSSLVFPFPLPFPPDFFKFDLFNIPAFIIMPPIPPIPPPIGGLYGDFVADPLLLVVGVLDESLLPLLTVFGSTNGWLVTPLLNDFDVDLSLFPPFGSSFFAVSVVFLFPFADFLLNPPPSIAFIFIPPIPPFFFFDSRFDEDGEEEDVFAFAMALLASSSLAFESSAEIGFAFFILILDDTDPKSSFFWSSSSKSSKLIFLFFLFLFPLLTTVLSNNAELSKELRRTGFFFLGGRAPGRIPPIIIAPPPNLACNAAIRDAMIFVLQYPIYYIL